MIFDYDIDGCTIAAEDKGMIESKIEKLSKLNNRLSDESTKAHIKVMRGLRHRKPNYAIRASITVPEKKSLVAQASGQTLSDAIDKVEAKLRNQAEKLDV